MSAGGPNDYTLWIGIANHNPDLELQRYIVILHKNNEQVCQCFSTSYVYKGRAKIGMWKHAIRSFDPRAADHAHCDKLYNKQFVCHVPAQEFERLTYYFDIMPPRESQFFVFRWLYLCVDHGLIRGDDVDRVKPVGQFGEGSTRWIDATK
ncbi:uncharacterized protein DSM5745_08524 [Aspergillus mulundensis]|uniref:Uncharacterized protein n=1 Tax=Aspergillus mulundensis TaxID=1810919 RepID=A0A3D8R4L9_9EURO|nr:hypothetical protein DSM5745_08524 [Aspergillus mulundensis]RDW68764.1 hypothetical protein DSM5745_08524 [Aspergillus mulundensis]